MAQATLTQLGCARNFPKLSWSWSEARSENFPSCATSVQSVQSSTGEVQFSAVSEPSYQWLAARSRLRPGLERSSVIEAARSLPRDPPRMGIDSLPISDHRVTVDFVNAPNLLSANTSQSRICEYRYWAMHGKLTRHAVSVNGHMVVESRFDQWEFVSNAPTRGGGSMDSRWLSFGKSLTSFRAVNVVSAGIVGVGVILEYKCMGPEECISPSDRGNLPTIPRSHVVLFALILMMMTRACYSLEGRTLSADKQGARKKLLHTRCDLSIVMRWGNDGCSGLSPGIERSSMSA